MSILDESQGFFTTKVRGTLLLVLWIVVDLVSAQPLNVTRYSGRDGLTATHIYDIAQDSSGFIWLATSDGLVSYDGREFRTLSPGDFTTVFCNGNEILFGRHSLTSGTFHPISGWEEKSPGIQSELPFFSDRHALLASGEMWSVGADGFYHSVGKQVERHPFPKEMPGEEWLLAATFTDLWAMTSSGLLFEWDPTAKRFESIDYDRPFNRAAKLFINGKDDLLVGTDQGFAQLKIKHGAEVSVRMVYQDSLIYDVAKDSNGNLWLGSAVQGIVKGISVNDSLVFRRVIDGSEPHRLTYLRFKSISRIFCDRDDNLWVAHEGGLSTLSAKPFVNLTPSLPNEIVRSLAFMNDGTVYISGIGGFYVAKSVGPLEYEVSSVDLGANRYPNAICECNDRLWIGATDNHLYYYENGRLVEVKDLRKRGGNIFYTFCDRDNQVWVSQAQQMNPIIGVLKINADLTSVEYGEKSGFSTRMLVTRQAPYGTIYCAGIGDTTYLYEFDKKNDRFENLSVPMTFDYGENFEVHDMTIGADSVIWLASTAGLLRFKNGEIQKIRLKEVYGQEIVAVTLSKEGVLWAAAQEDGLVRLDQTGSYSIFDKGAGIPSNIMWYRSLYTDANGRIWAASREGLSVSSSQHPSARPTRAPIFLSIQVNGAPAKTSTFDFHSSLEFHFTSLQYPTGGMSYQYRVSNWKQDWQEVHTRSLRLDELENGDYTVELRAKQNDGSTGSSPLTYTFTINRPWYGSNTAIGGYILLLIFVVITSVNIHNRSLLAEKKLLESKVNQRTKELQEKTNEVLARNVELKQLTDELATQNESIIEQKLLIETQNILLNQAKNELERKVEERTQELKRSNNEMAQQNVQLEQFAFMTAHNLRDPVALLLGLGSLFDFKKIEDPFTEDVIRRMIRSAKDLDETIREISTILHIKSGVNGIFTNTNLKRILDNVMNSFHEVISTSNVTITSELRDTHVVSGVEAYAYSIFHNSVSNSLKYADEFRPLAIHVSVQEPDDHTLVVVFEDNGIGFDSDMFQEKLFKPFTRFNTVRQGRGLGLYIMKIQMEMMNGSVSVDSKLDEGTRVVLTFRR